MYNDNDGQRFKKCAVPLRAAEYPGRYPGHKIPTDPAQNIGQIPSIGNNAGRDTYPAVKKQAFYRRCNIRISYTAASARTGHVGCLGVILDASARILHEV